MTISIDNFIYLARQQEQRKFPRILACGVGGSLVLHSMAAVALNYLPQQIPASVEVTLIDPSEIPTDLRPSPEPPKVKPTSKKTIAKVTPTPTPSVKVTPTPTPTPSVKVTPTPTPTPSVKITPTPTPTPSVKITPDTPQVVKIVTKPAIPIPATKAANDFEKDQNQARNLLPQDPNQQVQSVIDPNKKQAKSKPEKNPGASLQRGAGSPLNNTQLAFKDLNQSAQLNGLSGTEPDPSAELRPGKNNVSRAATPGNLVAKNSDSTKNNSQLLTAGRNDRSLLAGAQSSGTSLGDSASGGDSSELTFNPPGGLGGSPGSGGSVGGKNGNGLPPASAGKFGGVSNNGGVDNGDGLAGDEFGIALIPDNGRRGSRSRSVSGGESTSESSAKNNGNGLPSASTGTGKLGSNSGAGEIAGDEGNGFGIALNPGGRRGSQSAPGAGGSGANGQLAYDQTGSRGLGKNSEAGSDFGNGDDGGSLSGSNLGSLSRSRGSSIVSKATGFGSGLECENNCNPINRTVELNYNIKVSANITLDNSGKVIKVTLPDPSDNIALNNFTEDAFGKMKFKLPVSVTKRRFSVELNFQKTS